MIKNILKTMTLIFFVVGCFTACTKNETRTHREDPLEEEPITMEPFAKDPFEGGAQFYYSFNEKIFVQPIEDKVCLKFVIDADREQVRTLIHSVEDSLQQMYSIDWDQFPFYPTYGFVIGLETKNGKSVPLEILELLKANQIVVSATYMIERNMSLGGIPDDFVVKLKGTTSYKQLQILAEVNNCKVGKEDEFLKNVYTLYLSKTSQFNALQISCLFQETGLFEFSVPNFLLFMSKILI